MRKLKQEKLRRRISYELHLQAIKVNRGVLYFAQYKKNVQECDATMLNSDNKVGLINK